MEGGSHRLTIEQLQAFVLLAEELSFTRAAERLYIAPSPFGRRIKELEAFVGAPLFVRTTRRVRLTPAGERLLGHARGVLHELDGLLHAAREASDGTREIRVGIPPGGVGPDHRAAVLSMVREVAACTVSLAWLHPEELSRRLASGELDLAFVGAIGDAGPFDGVLVGAADFRLALPARHPAAARDPLDLAALGELRYAQIHIDPPTANSVELERRVLGALPGVERTRVRDVNELADIVASGDHFTIVTADGGSVHRALDDPELVLRSIAGWDYQRVGLVVWRRDLDEDPTLAAIVAELGRRFPRRPAGAGGGVTVGHAA